MKLRNTLGTLLLLPGILFLLLFTTCKKDPYEIGIDLLPPSDTLNVLVTDTCTVYSFSERVDSVYSAISPSVSLGGLFDPVFGKTAMSLFTQFVLSYDAPDFGKNPVLDSAVIMLYYNGYYGDTNTWQHIMVYELGGDLHYDSAYYSTQSVWTYPNLLADQWFKPYPSDSVIVYGSKVQAHLRINLSRLTDYFGNKILYAPASALLDNQSFIKYMKGLYIESQHVSSNGAFLSFHIDSPVSRLVVYFHNDSKDSLSFDLFLNSECARFQHIDHNGYLDADPDLKQQILNHDTTRGKELLFLQGLGGVKTKIKIPYIQKFGGGHKIAINDALLLMTNIDQEYSKQLIPPPKITLIRQDTGGLIGYLIDEAEGESYFGGTYDSTHRTYYFRITRHVQRLIDGYYTNNYDLYMLVNNPLSNNLYPNRVVLNGTSPSMPGSQSSRFRLKISYTMLN